jgi:uncharacterized SAM-binding protein YcdF (DUF218 family)
MMASSRASASAARRLWRWPASILFLALASWALAGCFMEGEDELEYPVPWLVVLGGGSGQERVDLACQLFAQERGHQGVVLTGESGTRAASDRDTLTVRCGVPVVLLHQWSTTADTFEELSALATMLYAHPGAEAIVVSDSLHMPRLRYARERLALNGCVYLRQCRPGGRSDPGYLLRVALFWFREPLAYLYYVLRY